MDDDGDEYDEALQAALELMSAQATACAKAICRMSSSFEVLGCELREAIDELISRETGAKEIGAAALLRAQRGIKAS